MKQYPKYKDSGVKSIGLIPEHWKVERMGKYFSFSKGLPITKADLTEKGVAVISYGQIHSKVNNGLTLPENLVRYVSPAFLESHPQCLLNKNDFVFADTSEDIDGAGNFVFNDYPNNIFAGYHDVVARPHDLEYPPYLAALFSSFLWKRQIQSLVNGVKVYSINKTFLKNSRILLPSIEEQKEIFTYTTKKTAQIDRFISETEKKIEKLNELKQAQIAHLVTHGLNSDASMKDSGIVWIGQIPEHWEIRKIKYLFDERTEKNHLNEPILCATQAHGVIPQSMYDNRVVVVNTGFQNLKFVEVGDFVISLRSFQGGIEYAHYQGIISAAYTILRSKGDLANDYTRYLFKSFPFIQLLKTCVKGIREGQNINYDMLKNNYLFVPPKQEQIAIVSAINNLNNKIDALTSDLTRQIDHLKELKQRIISDAVTGKIDVREEKN